MAWELDLKKKKSSIFFFFRVSVSSSVQVLAFFRAGTLSTGHACGIMERMMNVTDHDQFD